MVPLAVGLLGAGLFFGIDARSGNPEVLPTETADHAGAEVVSAHKPVVALDDRDALSKPDLGWPQLFGPHRDGTSHETGLVTEWSEQGPPEHWRLDVGTGYSAPVAFGDRMIVFHRQGDEEIVECLEAETGESLWTFAYPTAYECRYEYSDGPYSTPIIEDDRVYAWGAEGRLHCLNLDDGSMVWARSLSEEYEVEEGLFAVGASPLLEGDRLILNVGGAQPGSGIVAIDKQTGETLWTATDDGASYATPTAATIHNRRYVFVLTSEGLVSLDPNTGSVWWQIPFKPRKLDSCNAATPLVDGDLVLITAGPGAGSVCLRILPDGNYEEVWRDRRVLDSQYNNLICIDGFVYGYPSKWNGGAKFRCLELATGDLRWKWPSLIDRGASLAVDDRFILLGETGHLATMDVDPTEPRPISMTAEPIVGGPCYTAPALHRGLLYLRTERTLLCLNLRRAESTD